LCFAVIRHFEGDAELSQFVRNVPELPENEHQEHGTNENRGIGGID